MKRPYLVITLLVIAALAVAAYFLVIKSDPQPTPEQQARADMQYYFNALATRNWKAVCGRLTLKAQNKISGRSGQTCVAKLSSSPLALQQQLALAGRQTKIVDITIRGRSGVAAARRGSQVVQNRILLIDGNWVIDN